LIPLRTVSCGLLFAALATAASAQTRLELVSSTSPQTKIDRVLVLKRKHKLQLLSGEQVVKSYDVALGSGGLAPKRAQGDRRTPEGLYAIDWRNPASRFHRALHISYPQGADKQRARQLGTNPGGDIMIHGLGLESSWIGADHRRTDWTEGCIAVTDTEIEEIWEMVPDGTPVEIRR
jgi:murein L,D-transpeptidase YafK